MDYLPWSKVTIFGRYSDAPSKISQRAGSQTNYSTIDETKYRTQTLTVGSNQALTARLTNEFRFNYSRSRAHNLFTLDDFGGAIPPPNSVLYQSGTPQNHSFEFYGDFNPYGLRLFTGEFGNNLQQQFNVTDNISHVIGAHQIKLGLDFRRMHSEPVLRTLPNSIPLLFPVKRSE